MRALVVAAGLVSMAVHAQALEVATQEPAHESTVQLELTVAPVMAQLNSKFTQHVGTFGTVGLRINKRFSVQVLGGGNWYSAETAFNQELVEKFRVEAQASSSLLWTWATFGGFEVEPATIAFDVLGAPAKAGLTLGVALGLGGTRHTTVPGQYGDTGARFMASAAGGFRLQLGQRFVARLDVRDVMFSSSISQVDGCTGGEFNLSTGQPRGFGGTCTNVNSSRAADGLIRLSGTDVLHSLGLSLSAGVVF